ncbi:hypothetical protein LXL04_004685 [Taraxacum kok-saghyz]
MLNNRRYYPLFKDFIGVIDGTHVRASVGRHKKTENIVRKGYATQISWFFVILTCTLILYRRGGRGPHMTQEFSMKHYGDRSFVFCIQCVIISSLLMPGTQILKYILLHTKVHISFPLPDFQGGQTAAMRAPRGLNETFNNRHSSLRNIIERIFEVWKARWALLRDMRVNFTYEHQVQIVHRDGIILEEI